MNNRLPRIPRKVSIPCAAFGVRFSRRGDAFSEGPRGRHGRFKSLRFRYCRQSNGMAQWFRRLIGTQVVDTFPSVPRFDPAAVDDDDEKFFVFFRHFFFRF